MTQDNNADNEITKFCLVSFCCIFNKDMSKILLIKRNKIKREKYGIHWSNIGGKVELDEDALTACIRELKEEADLNLKPEDLTLLFIEEDLKTFKHTHVVYFAFATLLDEDTKIKINSEAEEYRWFNVSDLPEKRSNEDMDRIISLLKDKISK